MQFLSIFLYAASTVFVLCNALPLLPTIDPLHRNKEILIGLFALACIGTVVGACVCCRRRKRGFEEFKNESTTGETQRSEFPIFRALSPSEQEQSRSPSACAVGAGGTDGHQLQYAAAGSQQPDSPAPAMIIVGGGNHINIARDRLLDQDIDNNNGPISPADLENIENNNAVDYIPNRNEIGVVAEITNYTANRNLMMNSNEQHSSTPSQPLTSSSLTQPSSQLTTSTTTIQHHVYNNHPVANFNFNAHQHNQSVSSATIIQQIESQPSPPSPIALPIPINEIEYRLANVCSNYHNPFMLPPSPSAAQLVDSTAWTTTSYQTQTTQSVAQSTGKIVNETNLPNPFIPISVTEMVDTRKEESLVGGGDNGDRNKTDEVDVITTPISREESSSLQSVSSEKSTSEINSVDVEAALLCLDNVLADEDTTGGNDGNDDDDILGMNTTNDKDDDEKTLKHFILNSANNSMEFDQQQIVETTITTVATTSPTSSTATTTQQISHSNSVNLQMDSIKEEAKYFVDSVLSECERILMEKDSTKCGDYIEGIEEDMRLHSPLPPPPPPLYHTENLNPLNDGQNLSQDVNDTLELPPPPPPSNDLTFEANTTPTNYDEQQHHSHVNPLKTTSDDLLSEPSDLDDSSIANNTVIDLTKFNMNEDNSDSSNLKSGDSMENLFACEFTGGMSASTPMVKSKFSRRNDLNDDIDNVAPFPYDHNQLKYQFDSTFSPIESAEKSTGNHDDDDIKPLDKTYASPELVANSDGQNTFVVPEGGDGTFVKINDGTFVTDTEPSTTSIMKPPEIKIEQDDVQSEDMTTVTPVNTPIELNYVTNTWDKFVTSQNAAASANAAVSNAAPSSGTSITSVGDDFDVNQPSTSSGLVGTGGGGGWFLHPPGGDGGDATFDVDDDDEENEENLSLTFDMLRKQLAEVLPHAQGGMANPPDYSDDDDDSSTQNVGEIRSPANQQNADDLEMEFPPPSNEVIINYKRPLSPIMEESEDETCKTFVLNETKYLDSTSPGFMESSEVALGVAKPLMASNDTLFNVEDNFCDDPFSPRANSQTDLNKIQPPISGGGVHSSSSTPMDVTQTLCGGDGVDVDIDADSPTENGGETVLHHTLHSDDKPKLELNFESTKKFRSFELLSEECGGDICSPDQAKTFSESIQTNTTTTEQKSSDLSVTAADQDVTFTTVEEKTCITIGSSGSNHTFVKEDERISEVSEPEWEVTKSEDQRMDENSLMGVESLDVLINNEDVIDVDHVGDDDDVDDVLCEDVVDDDEVNDHAKSDEIVKNHNLKNEESTEDHNTKKEKMDDEEKLSDFSQNESQKNNEKDEGISSKEESGNETENSMNDENDKLTCADDDHEKTTQIDSNDPKNYSSGLQHNKLCDSLINSSNILDFLNKEIEYASSQQYKNGGSDGGVGVRDNRESGELKSSSNAVDNKSSITVDNANNSVVIVTDLDLNLNVNDVEGELKLNTENLMKQIGNQTSLLYKSSNTKNAQPILIEGNDRYLIGYNGRELIGNGNEGIGKLAPQEIIHPVKYQAGVMAGYDIFDIDGDVLVNHNGAEQQQQPHNLSGEEDPWSNYHTIGEIHFSGPATNDVNRAFCMNEWESEEDESNSSEEFMYVKGSTIDAQKIEQNESDSGVSSAQTNDSSAIGVPESVWASHEDQIPVAGVKKTDKEIEEESCDDDASDVEGEFVPSSWDAEAQPARSALKSPDKSSSDEELRCNKKRRSVAFKKQRYHSVYEYPREVIQLSPSLSEPQIWERDFSKSLDSTFDYKPDNDVLDGFMISSTTRPFHGSQFNAQCNTWPTDSDFSWSQFQSNDDQNIQYKNYSEIPVEWPRDFGEFFDKNNSTKDNVNVSGGDMTRPDSGVGESAELLSESSTSLGDLRHTKSSLRLPLNIVTVNSLNSSENIIDNELLDVDSTSLSKLENNYILPTPSCTGSMDSLSSSTGSQSERPMSFSTFGKTQQQNSFNNSLVGGNTITTGNKNAKNIQLTASATTITTTKLPPYLVDKTKIVLEDCCSSGEDTTSRNDDEDDDGVMMIDGGTIILRDETNDEPTSIIFIENSKLNPNKDITSLETTAATVVVSGNDIINHDLSKRQSDSTDEDSGIESIMRATK